MTEPRTGEPPNAASEVGQWFDDYDNPHKDLMLAIRAFILSVDPRIGECIKWRTPTFTYEGNIASFNPRSKKHVSLMFHTGATIPGHYPRLRAADTTAAYMTFTDADDFDAAKSDLTAVVQGWIRMKTEPRP